MIIAESILRLILMMIPLIVSDVEKKKDATRRLRKIIDDHESKNESADLLESADEQMRQLSDDKRS